MEVDMKGEKENKKVQFSTLWIAEVTQQPYQQ